MGLNYENLVRKGRAKAMGVEWSNEELEILVSISQTLRKDFAEIAPYIRNGVKDLDEYKKAVSKGLTPYTEEDAREIAKEKFQAEVKPKVKKKK